MEIRNLFHKAGSKWPAYGVQRNNKKQILRNNRENNARGVHIRLVFLVTPEILSGFTCPSFLCAKSLNNYRLIRQL